MNSTLRIGQRICFFDPRKNRRVDAIIIGLDDEYADCRSLEDGCLYEVERQYL